jgi:hypothetical protein
MHQGSAPSLYFSAHQMNALRDQLSSCQAQLRDTQNDLNKTTIERDTIKWFDFSAVVLTTNLSRRSFTGRLSQNLSVYYDFLTLTRCISVSTIPYAPTTPLDLPGTLILAFNFGLEWISTHLPRTLSMGEGIGVRHHGWSWRMAVLSVAMYSKPFTRLYVRPGRN